MLLIVLNHDFWIYNFLILCVIKWDVYKKHFCIGKNPFQMQARPMDCNVTDYTKFIGTVSDSTLQLPFKKIPLVNFWYSVEEEHL